MTWFTLIRRMCLLVQLRVLRPIPSRGSVSISSVSSQSSSVGLSSKGAHCFLSNSDTPLVRELYKDFNIKKVYARRAINSRADRRGPVGEVIVCSK